MCIRDRRHSSPEAEIRELIERAATAAEERNVRDLRALIADDYADERGLDRKAVENLLRLHVLRQQSIHLFVRVRGIEFPEPERALVSVAAAMAGRPVARADELALSLIHICWRGSRRCWATRSRRCGFPRS